MVGKVVLRLADDQKVDVIVHTLESNASKLDDGVWHIDEAAHYTSIEVATIVCFTIGVIQVIMYGLRLGVISSLLSETLVSGFTTGAGIHVLVSQIKDLLGIRLEHSTGNCKLIKVWQDFNVYYLQHSLEIQCWSIFTGHLSNYYENTKCQSGRRFNIHHDNNYNIHEQWMAEGEIEPKVLSANTYWINCRCTWNGFVSITVFQRQLSYSYNWPHSDRISR